MGWSAREASPNWCLIEDLVDFGEDHFAESMERAVAVTRLADVMEKGGLENEIPSATAVRDESEEYGDFTVEKPLDVDWR